MPTDLSPDPPLPSPDPTLFLIHFSESHLSLHISLLVSGTNLSLPLIPGSQSFSVSPPSGSAEVHPRPSDLCHLPVDVFLIDFLPLLLVPLPPLPG